MAVSFLPSVLASTSYLSAIFIPIIGWVLPGVVFAFLFLYIESDDISDIN
ncbi:photosystem I reaction center subunit VIII [Nostoc sp. 'Lobaria pulmonaria (5183) cyanobiont']|nr:photosystem I reaction center subunit VIII [Nostoc sp. 'Lobaria pulmonaria (5183) cyanobiont']AVH72743.1 photosystem I reaction center subunit VIII [Nostoc sp. 'Lobaria pulmonaria (5183) cyanobiont']